MLINFKQINEQVADLEGPNSNTLFEVLEEWNTVLLAERHLLEQALASSHEPHIAESQLCLDCSGDQRCEKSVDKTPADPPAAPKGTAKVRGMSQ